MPDVDSVMYDRILTENSFFTNSCDQRSSGSANRVFALPTSSGNHQPQNPMM